MFMQIMSYVIVINIIYLSEYIEVKRVNFQQYKVNFFQSRKIVIRMIIGK